MKRWSGRRDSNPRRPAWEVIRHSNLNHLESAGVGLESTETPGKTAVHRERLLMECNWSAAVGNDQQSDSPHKHLSSESNDLICGTHRTAEILSPQFPLLPNPRRQPRPLLHPMAINNNGPRWNASHRPNGVKIEFVQQQYTSPPSAKKRRKCMRGQLACKLATT